jgi:NADH-quinone oxidoreductase subunit J
MLTGVLFCVAAVGLLTAALVTVGARSPLRSALSLIVALCFLALLFLLLEAPFVAAMQILVYAGAVMVLFVFVIMLLNLGPDASKRPPYISFAKVLGGVAVGYIAWVAVSRMLAAPGVMGGGTVDGTVKNIGTLLLTDYLFAFETISVLLLVAVIGSVVLGLRKLT